MYIVPIELDIPLDREPLVHHKFVAVLVASQYAFNTSLHTLTYVVDLY